jgi:hypothetical protein
VTPGSIVQLVVKLRIASPNNREPNGITSGTSTPAEDVEDDEVDVDELIGRTKEGRDGEEPNSWAHAPLFPRVRPLRHLRSNS